MMTLDDLKTLDITDPRDQEIAYDYLRSLGGMMAELENMFSEFGAEKATEMFLRAVQAGCSESDDNERLLGVLSCAAYCHVLRVQRKQAN